jgi:HEAT repeat protein
MSRDDFEADRGPRIDGHDAPLPPVQPPSAGFIVQLFVVPALIVLAVVGVWALFGKIASSDEDWRELVEDIRNTNEHRRWRGANGLATLLLRDQQLGDDGQHLATNPDIARVLVDLFDEGLNRHSTRDDDLKQEAFLARTLGLLDTQATVLPALQHGMKPEQDREIRKNSIASIAVIAYRADEHNEAVKSPALVEDLVTTTSDPDSLIRDTATYALGLVNSPASRERLAVLVASGDVNTRVNAAVGLARQKSTAGLPVFKEILKTGSAAVGDLEAPGQTEALLSLKNVLHAVRILDGQWTPEQRRELAALIEPISQNHAVPRIRTDAIDALVSLRKDH